MKICRPGSFPGWQIYFLNPYTFMSAAWVRAMTTRFGSLQQGRILRSCRKTGTFTSGSFTDCETKVIWLRIGNCSTDQLEELLRSFSPAIEHFNADPASTLLMLP